jgi:hypothetical protein
MLEDRTEQYTSRPRTPEARISPSVIFWSRFKTALSLMPPIIDRADAWSAGCCEAQMADRVAR